MGREFRIFRKRKDGGCVRPMLWSESGRTRGSERSEAGRRGARRGNDPAEARREIGRGTGGNCETADGRITLMGREQRENLGSAMSGRDGTRFVHFPERSARFLKARS